MAENNLMVIGEKESFFIKVLIRKLKEAGQNAFFCPAQVDEINKHWEEASLISYYMEAGEKISGVIIIQAKTSKVPPIFNFPNSIYSLFLKILFPIRSTSFVNEE